MTNAKNRSTWFSQLEYVGVKWIWNRGWACSQVFTGGLLWLEGYEKVLQNLLDLEVEAAKKTAVDWASTLATAHRNSFRETTQVFFQTLSAQLKS